MHSRRLASNPGILVYAGAAIFLGLVGLVSGDFATGWQHVGPNVPLREPLAYLTAVVELGAGVALLVPRAARSGALALTVIYSIFTLLWVPTALAEIVHHNYDGMGNVFEEFSLVAAGLVALAACSPGGSFFSRQERWFARIFGLCPVSFGVVHIFDTMPGLTGWIPRWLPPNQLFWAYVTTISFFLAAAAILTGIMAPLAAKLLTAQIMAFELLVWIPKLIAGPRLHFNWAGNGIDLAIAGAAWVVADSLSHAGKRKAAPAEAPAKVGSAA